MGGSFLLLAEGGARVSRTLKNILFFRRRQRRWNSLLPLRKRNRRRSTNLDPILGAPRVSESGENGWCRGMPAQVAVCVTLGRRAAVTRGGAS